MSSEAFYKTLIGIIIKSDKTFEEKVSLLVSLQNDQKEIAFAHPKSTNGVLVEICSDIK